MGAAICSAVNDWIVEHWLDKEPRLRASIVVPPQSPTMAVEEIERLAGDRRFVQVLLPAACELMLGRSYYWPIYEAAVKHGLPVGIHAGSMYRYAPTSTGWPSHYLQDYISNNQLFEGQLLSLVSNGVFCEVPGPEIRIHRIRRKLATAFHVAGDQDMARRARRGALGEARRRRRSSAPISV